MKEIVEDTGFVPEKLVGLPYRRVFDVLTEGLGIRDYLHYDREDELWFGRVNVPEIVKKYGAPVLILNTEIIKQRVREWQEMAEKAALEVGYKGGSELIYAAKANPHSAAVVAADRAGCDHETSSFHDLLNLYGLFLNGVIKEDRLVVCNGFKLPPSSSSRKARRESKDVVFKSTKDRLIAYADDCYADLIIRMITKNYPVVPVLDSGEMEYFRQKLPQDRKTEVGLRAKFGKATTMEELAQLESRHGMSWEELKETAEEIRKSSNLELAMLHTMVGAAETIPIEKFVASLSLAADMYFALKKDNLSLQILNIGGGMAPRSEKGYDHERFLQDFFTMLKHKAAEYNLPEPEVIFEFGSYVVADAASYVFKVIQEKSNQVDKNGRPVIWEIVDGGLMQAMLDRFILKRKFLAIAGDHANNRAILVKIGDTTCDSDGKNPDDIYFPQNAELVVFPDVGAYQDILGGMGGIGHCITHEPELVIVEMGNDHQLHDRGVGISEKVSTREPLGYTPEDYKRLKETV